METERNTVEYIYINVGQSLPWHKVLNAVNAVVAELSIYK